MIMKYKKMSNRQCTKANKQSTIFEISLKKQKNTGQRRKSAGA